MRAFAAASLVLTVASAAACSIDVSGEEIVVREQKRYTVDRMPELSVRTFDGAITVESWDRNEIAVEIERRAGNRSEAEALPLATDQTGNRVTLDASSPRNRGEGLVQLGRRSRSVSFNLRVPRQLTLDVTTGDGPITTRGVAGTITLHSGDGPIRVESSAGDLRVDTGDGPITIADAEGGLEINTGDGQVEVGGRLESLHVNTGDGPVRVDARTGSVMKQDWSINSGDGPVTVQLPTAFDADVDAHTGDGPVTASGVSSDTPPDERERGLLRGRIGNGGHVLRIRTGDGPIAIRR
jgi:hypothetical protein